MYKNVIGGAKGHQKYVAAQPNTPAATGTISVEHYPSRTAIISCCSKVKHSELVVYRDTRCHLFCWLPGMHAKIHFAVSAIARVWTDFLCVMSAQFEAGSGNPFLYDNMSAHGTLLNKKRLKPKVYAPLRVGDMIKFGQSSRLYVLQGPAELMPEEGPSRRERREMAMLAAQQDRREREAQ
eukprot:scaffold223125_cov39-Prasinocladus_malaysianus.AAC.1